MFTQHEKQGVESRHVAGAGWCLERTGQDTLNAPQSLVPAGSQAVGAAPASTAGWRALYQQHHCTGSSNGPLLSFLLFKFFSSDDVNATEMHWGYASY